MRVIRIIKLIRAYGGCLGARSRRRTQRAAKSLGEPQAGFDPGISEWGNPHGVNSMYPILNKIGMEKTTGGTETSKYPEEQKESLIP